MGLWVAVIFTLSTDGFSAASTSSVLDPLVLWLLPDISEQALDTLHGAIRKGAHVGVYAGLALLVLRALRIRSAVPQLRAGTLSLAFVVAVAALDETHQGFASQRTGSVSDVGLDLLGGAIALALVCIVVLGRTERRSRASSGS